MKFSAKHLFATLSMLTVLMVTPTSAFAGDSVYVNVPSLTIGFHGNSYSHKRYRKHYKKKYYNNGYSDRGYKKRRYRDRSYSNKRYSNNYYSGGRSYNKHYDRGNRKRYNNSYKGKSDCYGHKDHYHCS